MEIQDLVNEVISKKNKTITDEVFLLIQNDRGLMQKYMELISKKGIKTVNSHIGKFVMKKYNLSPDENRNYEPQSTLISSYQEFV